ncbi:MAG: F0F1 ATP synthase subunit A [Bdellovibrionales bacterium]|jgi:F-type H+-transporting ATPase subunit a|nr:F0F1 ATP synthase subunit A [Bdellovibrionales bacterium]MBT3525496.1 F0F1 ATP synthase subunit A [Bdellovibrionales bacterium]MBT7670409.1 F0F1 ATP synthase subunit A [Bdellovibrionales bacterium]MBT7766753.1 F0F1 ATP synthase subunit A [Bdellovibrionales bacterium]
MVWRIILSLSVFIPVAALASGGFTWLGLVEHSIHVPQHIISFVLVAVLLIGTALYYRRQLASVNNIAIPDSGFTLRNLVEAYGQFIYNQCKMVLGDKDAPTYFPFIATIFLFILCSNLLGLIPGFLPPTEHLSTTLALGIFSFVYYNIKGCKVQGTWNYIKHFCGPLWYMAILVFPIEIVSNLVRPISLALRLRGNMMGDHLVLGTFTDLVPLLVPVIFYVLGLLVCVIQAYVFTMLSMVYISLAVSHQDHDEH